MIEAIVIIFFFFVANIILFGSVLAMCVYDYLKSWCHLHENRNK